MYASSIEHHTTNDVIYCKAQSQQELRLSQKKKIFHKTFAVYEAIATEVDVTNADGGTRISFHHGTVLLAWGCDTVAKEEKK